MKVKTSAIVVLCMVLATIAGNAQGKPLAVRLCDVVRSPAQYDKKLVVLRAQVSIGFEDFSLLTADCGSSSQTRIWLAFGGDIESPTLFCCGDHSRKPGTVLEVQGVKLPVTWDSPLQDFLAMLKEHVGDKRPQPIEVTMIGRYFAGERKTGPDGKQQYAGYGQRNAFSLLVIQRVFDPREPN